MEDNSRISRRGFIASSVSGLAAVGLTGLSAGTVFAQEKAKKGEIIYRALGKTGIRLPIVNMGVMNANNPEIVHAAYEAGIRHFDTASRYQYGRNEQMVGDVIKKLGARDKVIIGTKELLEPGDNDDVDAVIADLRKQTEGSLRRLRTDYVDIMYIHSINSAADANDERILEAMKVLKKEGKIRFSGVSTHENMAEVISAVAEKGSYDVVLTAINVTMADDTGLLGAIGNAASKGIAIVAMKTQAGGQRLPNRDSLREFDNATIAAACLKWVMRNKDISTSIPGFDNYTHLNEDFSVAYGLEYTDAEKKFLSDNNLTLGMGYCRLCRKCVDTCPYGVNVPDLMRVHMYGAQYANFQHARMELEGIGRDKSIYVCSSCAECVARCSNRVDIKNRIENLKAIYA